MPDVSLTRDGAVATITLNRPDRLNALTEQLHADLAGALAEAADPGVRAVVLTGAGRAFCVGQDIDAFPGDPAAVGEMLRRSYHPNVLALHGLAKPVVAAVNGVAAGAGASLAFACDLRVVAESAGFNLAFPGVALSCDTGASWTLPRLVGRAKAIELLYFPSTIPAATALELGLATSVVPDDQLGVEVATLAAKLAAGPTLSYASMRQSVNFSSTHDLPESLAFEADQMNLTGASEDHRNAVSAFVAKEKPSFRGR